MRHIAARISLGVLLVLGLLIGLTTDSIPFAWELALAVGSAIAGWHSVPMRRRYR